MYQISELAKLAGMSRTALLYYEKLDLIKGKRLENGYRLYTDIDLQRIRLIQQLHQGGLTLKECRACLIDKMDRTLIEKRLSELDVEIEQKQQSRNLLASMLGIGDEKAWHETLINNAPDAYLAWIKQQGFNEREALRLKWLSKNMTQHEQYMNDFMKVFATLTRWGPGSEHETLKALSNVPITPKNILEIGCGKGLATLVLASNLSGDITSVDNEQSALDSLTNILKTKGVVDRVKPLCASMTDLPFACGSFDLIWSEASAYIMGVESALAKWKSLLSDNGVLVFSDLVLVNSAPSKAVKEFWDKEYPDIQTVDTRRKQITAAGYEIISDFEFNQFAWDNYYLPLKKRIEELAPMMKGSTALKDITSEVEFYFNHNSEYGYQMFILQKI